MTSSHYNGLSNLDYHVLLALAGGAMHGYALAAAIAEESGGRLRPRAGSMYRVVARLIGMGLVDEAEPDSPADPHPGLARRYYGLTRAGRSALSAEARQLRQAAALAERRLRTARS